MKRSLTTRKGIIHFPTYVPVTTFGKKYPLDELIQPYFPRLAQAVMVSYHYAKQMKTPPRLPLFVDSGGFAALFEGSTLRDDRGLGVLRIQNETGGEELDPATVLDFQEKHADVAFTLDFPIPPGTTNRQAQLRQELTIANAIWAIRNRRRSDLKLYACIQAWDPRSAAACAAEMMKHPFDGFAIGGLVPRVKDWPLVTEMVESVLGEMSDSRPLHVFGVGKPDLVQKLYAMGVDSVDSSSYVKLAADGKRWDEPGFHRPDATSTERLEFAIANLAAASRVRLPLSVMMDAN
jgi:tRNA-guanine family transglycosylase